MVFPFKSIEDFKIDINNEHELFRKSVREFLEKNVEPRWKEIEDTNQIPPEIFKAMGEQGFFGIGIPEEYGGQGGGQLMTTIMMEEIARIVPSLAVAVGVNHLFGVPILKFGSEELKKKYIMPIARGEAQGAHANTEPSGGSDVAGIQSRAEKQNDHYVINGRKVFISGAEKADYFIVSARTNPQQQNKRWWGITVFVVEKNWPGVKLGQHFKVIGMRGEQPYEVIFDNVKVPQENVVGKVDEGFKVIVSTYDYTRIGIAAQAVGIAQATFEKALNYSLQRELFGQQIINFEMIDEKIAEMYMKLEAARLLTYWAASLADANRSEFIIAASLAKSFASEAAEWISRQAVQIHGGYGVDQEMGLERYLRDSVITTIYEGTNEIQRLTIARELVRQAFGLKI
ncbi:acyl-CoA dehydrogenase [Caldisphaera lagunensis DSM 15908]|uniref:Acyl-CoA dehydrogenase n=1 Tax=Caldisphaera lagunensis (strain DSM 15908 / JCM 11604 / ANMR 0165 / IC-154) TaxID=1056495 RepID=L0ACI0_CALLD|nr:acyl-CoA dehydrogenase family protein [Caldisphaera lagunensis]AFZ70852.1 acyl-CoA dehydrogenase [Caldisphaera lagunensis DSM 15908]